MGRSSRVLSFMSTFGGPPKSPPGHRSSAAPDPSPRQQPPPQPQPNYVSTEPTSSPAAVAVIQDSPATRAGRARADSRPVSMIGGYLPPQMDTNGTVPELLPIFTFLNSHSNKLYQEGYFLKLNDLDTHGRPYPDRSWTECFAQLVGTVLSLWDASALDAAGQEGEVPATFMNLADASIKMIETLETRSRDAQPLQNVLSISTAGKNRFLFHFSNINALTQWTAGIRLAMFENSSLQEAYTGSLIAGKGRDLNNIKSIMTQTKFKTEEWTRVRFGAGTPWRRCWCVITPPDEKEIQKAQKVMKKRSAYDRHQVILKGDVKFYDTKKTKKVTPIATISDAYSAYAIYPQSKPLIEQSTLVKIEGRITIHSRPETMLESFIFVMPEVRPAISGFEMLLRFLFPIWDVFALYGRPAKLIPDTLDPRSLMFAMPKSERYGYLEILDVAGLVHAPGSQSWKESEWKKELKQLTAQRISKMSRQQSQASRIGSVRGHRNSLPSRSSTLRFQDEGSMRSTPSLHDGHHDFKPQPIPHTDSAPPGAGPFAPPEQTVKHSRSISSEFKPAPPMHRRPRNFTDVGAYIPSRLSRDIDRPRDSFDEEPEGPEEFAPPPPVHTVPVGLPQGLGQVSRTSSDGLQHRSSSESERRSQEPPATDGQTDQGMIPTKPPSPVAAPPAFSHEPGAKPQKRPYHSPELRRANSRMSSTTLSQLAAAGNAGTGGVAGTGTSAMAGAAAAAAMANASIGEGRRSEDQGYRGVNDDYNTDKIELPADYEFRNKGLALENAGLQQNNSPSHRSQPESPTSVLGSGSNLRTPNKGFARSVSPLSQVSTLSPPPPRNLEDFNSYFQPSSTTITPGQIFDSGIVSPVTPEQRPTSRPVSSGKITRKPVPSPTKDAPKPEVSPTDDYRARDIDDAIINRINTIDSDTSTASPRYSQDSSRYDTDSVASPDYDSPEASITGRAQPLPPDRPRTGVLKTVGTVDPAAREVVVGDVRYKPEENQTLGSGIPSIDFGPTQLYRPELQPAHGRSKSADRPSYQAGNPSSDNLLQGNGGRVTPGHVIDAYNRSPSRSALPTPEGGPSRNASAEARENGRSMLWAPGAATGTGRQSPGPSLTPEQYVQQRAATNRVPAYSHQRQGSSPQPRTNSRQDSRTPPLASRPISGDWSGVPRPSSRGAGTLMNAAQDYSQHLSAREQEHVARMTNSPLISLAGNSHQRSQSQGGLVGAIEAREQEKKAMKDGYGGIMVQQAIAQRNQQAQAQAPQMPQYQYPQQSPQLHIPGQFPITPQVDQASWDQQQQQYFNQYAQSQYGYQSQAGYSPRQPQQGYYNQQQQQQQQYSPSGQYYNSDYYNGGR